MVTYNWGDVRMRALKRDKYTCRKCGKKPGLENLIGDHIKPIALGGDEWDLDNVQTLCTDCDKIKTRQDMKKIAELRRKEKEESFIKRARAVHSLEWMGCQ